MSRIPRCSAALWTAAAAPSTLERHGDPRKILSCRTVSLLCRAPDTPRHFPNKRRRSHARRRLRPPGRQSPPSCSSTGPSPSRRAGTVSSAACRARVFRCLAIANPLRGLANDAEYLRSVIDRIDGPVVVAGHSYGGSVASEATEGAGNVRALGVRRQLHPGAGREHRRARRKVPRRRARPGSRADPVRGRDRERRRPLHRAGPVPCGLRGRRSRGRGRPHGRDSAPDRRRGPGGQGRPGRLEEHPVVDAGHLERSRGPRRVAAVHGRPRAVARGRDRGIARGHGVAARCRRRPHPRGRSAKPLDVPEPEQLGKGTDVSDSERDRLDGRRALVTGGSKGSGKAVAETPAGDGRRRLRDGADDARRATSTPTASSRPTPRPSRASTPVADRIDRGRRRVDILVHVVGGASTPCRRFRGHHRRAVADRAEPQLSRRRAARPSAPARR